MEKDEPAVRAVAQILYAESALGNGIVVCPEKVARAIVTEVDRHRAYVQPTERWGVAISCTRGGVTVIPRASFREAVDGAVAMREVGFWALEVPWNFPPDQHHLGQILFFPSRDILMENCYGA